MDPALTYASYLRVDDLLDLQHPRSDGPEHDEMLFIVIHQVYELWFKEILHEIDRVKRLLEADEAHRAQHTLKRILTILKVLVAQLDILETMTPLEFLSFRERLEAASGFQSDQFRQLEFALGRKSTTAIERFAAGSRARLALERRFHETTLWDAFLRYLAREGYAVPTAAIQRDVTGAIEPSEAIQQILLNIYHTDSKNSEVCERLVDLDEGVQEWRYRHVKMVERTIGGKTGTGGSTGAAYLQATIGSPLFPDLWQIRSRLSGRAMARPHRISRPDATVMVTKDGPAMAGPYDALPLAAHYSRFRVTERILLTGHSHQAWPDVAFDAQQRAWLDAAELVDDKWERAAQIAEEVRAGWRRLLNDTEGDIALGQNTHELVVRLLSAVLTGTAGTTGTTGTTGTRRARARLVTTDGEFHTIRRQLDRLAEEGLDVVKVAARPVETLAERLALAIDERVACVLVSSVLFETAEIVPNLAHVAAACERVGTHLLVDAYHHLNVVPFDIHAIGLSQAFIVGGGYKYCQLGEGNCFLRVPAGCEMRPVITGWFSEFSELAAAKSPGDVRYGEGGARFAGATYDPTSHYRAAAVFRFHEDMGLTPVRLREISRHQTALLQDAIRSLDLDPRRAEIVDVAPDRRAGFLAIRMANAESLVGRLRTHDMFVDARGDLLRIGPAPYVSDEQLQQAVNLLQQLLT